MITTTYTSKSIRRSIVLQKNVDHKHMALLCSLMQGRITKL